MRTAPVIVFPRPLDIVPILDGDDVMLLPAMWPVRLTPDERRAFAQALLDLDEH
ncbi:hypothetical protein [Streptosporangium jomthongense]|uniref:Uncharacterized protein n=1 Tax=Streptosporangium jomthongense TaxID=1193683 RepID=A0ABV8FH38_9ACTN